MNESALLLLGELLQRRGYDFIQPSVANIKRYRRSPDPATPLLHSLFGWGVPQAEAAIDCELLETMASAGILERGAESIGSSIRAASIRGQLCFHTSGPGAARDAVFIGPDTYSFIDAMEAALDQDARPLAILEVGCGSGAASIWLAQRFAQARVVGCDINPGAIGLAQLNRRLAGVDNLGFVLSNVVAQIDGEFDLIVSNPPFIADDQGRTYRDGGGLFGLELPIRIIVESGARLRAAGRLLMFTASPVAAGAHILQAEMQARGLAHTLHQLEAEAHVDSLGQPAYRDIERIASVLLALPA